MRACVAQRTTIYQTVDWLATTGKSILKESRETLSRDPTDRCVRSACSLFLCLVLFKLLRVRACVRTPAAPAVYLAGA